MNPSDMILDDGNVIPGSFSWWLCFGVLWVAGRQAGRLAPSSIQIVCWKNVCARPGDATIVKGPPKGAGHIFRGAGYTLWCVL